MIKRKETLTMLVQTELKNMEKEGKCDFEVPKLVRKETLTMLVQTELKNMEKEGKCDFEVPKLVAHRPYRLAYSERVCGSKLANWRKLAQLFEQSISAFVIGWLTVNVCAEANWPTGESLLNYSSNRFLRLLVLES
ncbi:hypothetical protein QE152_g7918 [Popillia japonica]|uniref:Uncharacterized protein n=1 Tax=Popillia japonica TaxID=7064 RepID=A0AAW1MDK8_POPJA